MVGSGPNRVTNWARRNELTQNLVYRQKDNLKWVTNEVANFLNTLIGAIFSIMTGLLLV
jgi:uncharacterized membrane protein